VDSGNSRFGEYLKELIKAAGMTQAEFYTALGIKKPYFYDIVSGRVSPPPHPLQFKAMEILKTDEEAKERFFDLAAKGRGDMPADITRMIADNPAAIKSIRKDLKHHAFQY
jgi:transcriptional regulator with XRE-family HTH domain